MVCCSPDLPKKFDDILVPLLCIKKRTQFYVLVEISMLTSVKKIPVANKQEPY